MTRVTETALFYFYFVLLLFFFVPGSCFIKFAGETEGKENRQREKKKKKKNPQSIMSAGE